MNFCQFCLARRANRRDRSRSPTLFIAIPSLLIVILSERLRTAGQVVKRIRPPIMGTRKRTKYSRIGAGNPAVRNLQSAICHFIRASSENEGLCVFWILDSVLFCLHDSASSISCRYSQSMENRTHNGAHRSLVSRRGFRCRADYSIA